jgi:2-hydroxy-6-oxonona-2,4-dienedioate hydrolase
MMDQRSDPSGRVRELESLAQRFETPCGPGRVVWHRWGAGPAVLLLHGGSGSWLHWLPTIPALAQRHTVWVPDLPGMGESGMRPEPTTFESYADVLEHGFRSLTKEPADVAGFSFGTSFSCRLAPRLGARHMVLSGATFLGIQSGRGRALLSLRRIQDPAERLRAVRHNLLVMMIAHEANADELAVHLYDVDTKRRRLPRGWVDTGAMVRELLPRVGDVRVTAIAGGDDHVIGYGSARQSEALHALCPEARYVSLDGAGHWVMYEAAHRYSEALLRALED